MFPVWISEGRLTGPPAISYPLIPSVVPSAVIWTTVTAIPVLVILLFQVRVRDSHDATVGIFGVGKAIAIVVFISSILQHYIGGFRPHFLDVCTPDPDLHAGTGFGKVYFDINICTAKDKARIHYAFPSNRTAVAFAAAVFLALYINAKLKVFADYGSRFWKQILVLNPILGAIMIGGGLIVDRHNHLVDVLFGAWLGTAAAILAYRSSYAAVLDYRYNHIPFAFEKAQQRFLYTEGSVKHLANETIATKWWGQSDEEKADSAPPPRFNLGIFDGANDRGSATTEARLSPTDITDLHDAATTAIDEETRRTEIWKGKQRSTSPDAEVLEGQSCGLSFDGSYKRPLDIRPRNQSPPPMGFHSLVAKVFAAQEAGLSNAGGASPVEGVPEFALNDVLTKVNHLLVNKPRTTSEEGLVNDGGGEEAHVTTPPQAMICQDSLESRGRVQRVQESEGSSSRYVRSDCSTAKPARVTTSRNGILPATNSVEEGVFDMEMPGPSLIPFPPSGLSRLFGGRNGNGKGKGKGTGRDEGDCAERGEVGDGDRVKTKVS
ncbi:MAG: hypothetical protein M1836_001547 [Candelina mexicana]|nr:MAG: hypothetical protein M1836_001547 [Candelina mexicana]